MALAELIEERREEVLARWQARVGEGPPGSEASRSALRREVADFLDGVVHALRRPDLSGYVAVRKTVEVVPPARAHGRCLFQHGFELQLVRDEYRVLREVILDLVDEVGYQPTIDELRVLGDAITTGIVEAVLEYAEARARALAETQRLVDEREAQFRTLADSIPQLVWITDPDGSVTWFNQRWYEYTGATFEDCKGWGWLKLVHEDHVQTVEARWRARLQSNDAPWEVVVPLRSKDGEYRSFLTRALPLRDAKGNVVRWFGTSTDIEDRRRAAEQLALLFDLVPDLLCIANIDGYFVRVNPAFEKTLGWTEKELLERPLAEFVHPDDRARTLATLRSVIEGTPTYRFENRYLTKWGNYVTLSWAAIPATKRGFNYAVARDVTEQKRDEEFRERFFGIVAHDLRTPLTAIQTGASLLLRLDEMPEGALRVARRISSSAERMQRMISELLDLTRARIGPGLQIQRERADFAEIVERAIDEVNVAYPTRTIRYEAERGLLGEWDAGRLTRIASNLIKNALDYSPKDSPVEVSLRRKDDHVELCVHNANLVGPIPENEIPMLFDPFRRGSETARRTPEGLGLGLYITREIVLAHGGTIDVVSNENGTTFIVRLPFAAAMHADART